MKKVSKKVKNEKYTSLNGDNFEFNEKMGQIVGGQVSGTDRVCTYRRGDVSSLDF